MEPLIWSCAAASEGKGPPQVAERAAVVWASSLLPVVVPLEAFDPVTRATLASSPVGRDGWPLEQRVAQWLSAERASEAWRQIAADGRPVTGALDAVLAPWVAAELRRLGVETAIQRGKAIVPGSSAVTEAVLAEVRAGLADAQQTVPFVSWPRWSGPLLVCAAGDIRGIPATGVIRPALPLLQLPEDSHLAAVGGVRPWAAGRITALAVALSGPPAGGWPPWLQQGLAGIAEARARGEGLRSRQQRQLRFEAGAEALNRLVGLPQDSLLSPEQQRLARALAHGLTAAPKALAAVMDLLRHGSALEEALRIGARTSLDELALPP